jgi:hypothetical protein
MADVSARRAELDDQQAIMDLVGGDSGSLEELYGPWSLFKLIENSFLSISAFGPEGELLGFASFAYAPERVKGDETAWLDWFRSTDRTSKYTTFNTLWLSFLVVKDGAPSTLQHILRTAYTTLPHLEHVVYLLPEDKPSFDPVRQTFEEIASPGKPMSGDYSDYAYKFVASDRVTFIPKLAIRQAQVEDHDDLVNVFEAQSESLVDQYGEFFLAELIESQDEENKVRRRRGLGPRAGVVRTVRAIAPHQCHTGTHIHGTHIHGTHSHHSLGSLPCQFPLAAPLTKLVLLGLRPLHSFFSSPPPTRFTRPAHPASLAPLAPLARTGARGRDRGPRGGPD